MNNKHVPTYNSWKAMHARCKENAHCKRNYYDIGISVCDEWKSFDVFFNDMGERPDGKSLDRINPHNGYYKANCRWVDYKTQMNNKRSSSKIEKDGVIKTISEWCEFLDLTETQRQCAYKRYTSYNCKTFEELFHDGSLLQKRVSERINSCESCDRTTSIKWRNGGKLCNTCYHRELRKRKNNDRL